MKLASTKVIADLVEQAHRDLDHCLKLWPHVAAQKLLRPVPSSSSRPLPTSPHGYSSKLPNGAEESSQEGNSDPTGEQVCSNKLQVEADDHRAQLELLDAVAVLRRHVNGIDDAFTRIRHAQVSLARSLPAVDAALNAGHEPTDGQSAAELDLKRRNAVEAEAACEVCSLGVSRIGPLYAGMCLHHWTEWVDAGRPDHALWILNHRVDE